LQDAIVLDTSVFTNPDTFPQFGENPEQAVENFIQLASRSPLQFFMPLSVYQELQKVVDFELVSGKLELVVKIRSPRRFMLMIPAEILYQFIEELRERINKGLRIAEQALTTRDISEEELIRRLRARYREALRQGIIDSKEDMDVILLAFELDAVLVSADQGISTWADKLGIKLLEAGSLRSLMESSIEHRLTP
jgi:hypothetical protein